MTDTVTCADCGKTFTYEKRTMRRIYCDACRDGRVKARKREYGKSHRYYVKHGDRIVQKTIVCEMCGKEYSYSQRANGRRKSYCDTCVILARCRNNNEYYKRNRELIIKKHREYHYRKKEMQA